MNYPSKLRFAGLLASLLATTVFTTPAVAQDENNDGIASAWHIVVKEGQREMFESKVKEFNAYLADKEDAWDWTFYSVLTGPDTGDYIVRSGGHNWADFDVEQEWEDEADAWFDENLAPLVETMTRSMTRADRQVQSWPDEDQGVEFRYFNVQNWYVHNGHGQAFNQGLRKIHGHMQDGGFDGYYGAFYMVSGGPANMVTLVSGHKNWADMAEPDPSFEEVMLKAMTEEEMSDFMQSWSKTFKSGDTVTVALRRDLSTARD